MEAFHRIRAWLYDNILNSDDPGDLVARVVPGAALGVDDISRRAASHCGAGMTEEVIACAVGIWLREMAGCLCDGFTVDADGWFAAAPGIKGSFNSPDGTFDPKKHTLRVDFRQGVQLRRELEATGVEISGMAGPSMGIVQVIDMKSGSVNDLATPGHPLRICGNRLRIAGSSPAVGVWFTSRATGERMCVTGAGLLFNKPGELIVSVPQLAPGAYTLEITTRYGADNVVSAEPHTTAFDRDLTVSEYRSARHAGMTSPVPGTKAPEMNPAARQDGL